MLLIMMKCTGIEIITHKQCAKTSSSVRIPHFECPVIRGRHDEISRRTEGTPSHLTCMAAQGQPLLSSMYIPHFERLVLRSRYDKVSCRTDRASIHSTHMPT